MNNLVEPLETRVLFAAGVHASLSIPPAVAGEPVQQLVASVHHPASVSIQPTASINWGDGSSETVAVGATSGTVASLSATHTYANPGTYSARVTFETGTNSPVRVARSVHVGRNSPGGMNLRAKTGRLMQGSIGTIASATAPGSVTVEWGDGLQGSGTATAAGKGRYKIVSGHAYATAGTYQIRVLANGASAGAAALLDSTVHVTGPAVTLNPPTASITPTTGTAIFQGNAILGQVTGLSPDPNQKTPYALVSWDTSTPAGIGPQFGLPLLVQNGQYFVQASAPLPANMNPSTHTATIRVMLDDHVNPALDTQVATAQETFTVEPTSQTALIVRQPPGQTFTTFLTDVDAPAGTTAQSVTLQWGDSNFVIGTGNNPAFPGDSGALINLSSTRYAINGTHTYAAADTYEILGKVQFSDGSWEWIVTFAVVS